MSKDNSSEIETTLRELLGDSYSESFATKFVKDTKDATPDSIRASYSKLIKLGLTPDKIANQAQLLSLNSQTLLSHYNSLRNYLSKEQVRDSHSTLLGNSPKTVASTIQFLNNLSISPNQVTSVQLGTTQTTLRSKMGAFMSHVLDANTLPHDNREKRLELAKQTRKIFSKSPLLLMKSAKDIKKNATQLKARFGLI